MRPGDGRAIPTFIRQALAGEPLTVAGDGSQTRSVCYLDDTVDDVLRMLASNLTGPVNIGNPDERSVCNGAGIPGTAAGTTGWTGTWASVHRVGSSPATRPWGLMAKERETSWPAPGWWRSLRSPTE